jgi:hypothetical protein
MQQAIARPVWLRLSIFALATFAAVACKSDSASLPTAATVTLSGAPTAAMYADIHWSSSAPEVASVSGSGLLSAHAAGTTTVTASSGTGTATAQVTVVAALAVSTAPVSLPDGSLTLSLLPGLGGSRLFVVNRAPAAWADAQVVPGTLFELRRRGHHRQHHDSLRSGAASGRSVRRGAAIT